MKNPLFILLCLPFIGFGQAQAVNPQFGGDECLIGDCLNGYGKYSYVIAGVADGAEVTYEGYFKDGKYNGLGKLICPSLGEFQGETGSFLMHGTWKDGSLDGDAIVIDREQEYSTGLNWESTYTNLLYEKKIIYSGEYKDGSKHGFGCMIISIFNENDFRDDTTGRILYIGQWKDGYKSGFGRYFYRNGNVYEGEWKNDKRHGNGSMRYSDGSIDDGLWEYDRFIMNNSSQDLDESNIDVSKLTGKWKGQYNGDENGRWIAQFNQDGTVDFKIFPKSQDGTVFRGSGEVNQRGEFITTVGSTSTDTKFEGWLSQGRLVGTWYNKTLRMSGTFISHRLKK